MLYLFKNMNKNTTYQCYLGTTNITVGREGEIQYLPGFGEQAIIFGFDIDLCALTANVSQDNALLPGKSKSSKMLCWIIQ